LRGITAKRGKTGGERQKGLQREKKITTQGLWRTGIFKKGELKGLRKGSKKREQKEKG